MIRGGPAALAYASDSACAMLNELASLPIFSWGESNETAEADACRPVREGLREHAEFHAVPGAGHLSFLAPCGPVGPPVMCKIFKRTLAPLPASAGG